MRYRRLLWVIAVLFASQCAADPFVGSWQEYSLGGSALVASAILERWPPNDHHPLIGGEQKSYIERERVPDWSLGLAHAAALGAIRFGPGGDERIRHAHGYAMAASLTSFSASLAKGLVGRRRPDHDAARALGKSTRSKSFYSGHASSAFCLATYATLYARERTSRTPYRVAVPLVLYSAATYTSWTRVVEHRHYPSDVVAGAIAGCVVAAGVYRWYDGLDTQGKRISVAARPGRLLVAVAF